MDGHSSMLPYLLTGRWAHGCGSYKDSWGDNVLLVTAGFHKDGYALDSTEILYMDSMFLNWREVASYPFAVSGLSGATLGNSVFMTGGQDKEGYNKDNVYKFDQQENAWVLVGHMEHPMDWHAVSVVERILLDKFC